MPTQIPVPPKASWTAATVAVLIGTLLAAVIIGGIDFIVIWAYANF
jgi:preprotein translocase subunit SecE